MRILVVSSIWPRPSQSTLSANVVIFELIKELSRQPDTHVLFLKINLPPEGQLNDDEKAGIKAMSELGVEVLEPLNILSLPSKRPILWRFLRPRLEDFYPCVVHGKLVEKTILQCKPDVLFIPWDEGITTLCADIPVVKFAYYGNRDHKPAFAMARFNFEYGKSNFLKFILQKIHYKHLEKIHIKEMFKYEILGDVSNLEVQYYINKGHSNAFYIQNVWMDKMGDGWRERRRDVFRKNGQPAMIIASMGRLDATANVHGLHYLYYLLLPKLREIMAPIPFELHVFGAGNLHSSVAGINNEPEIHIRGFVPDVDSELLKSTVFLCPISGSDYKTGHTRILHAWSLGCCVVAHRDAALAIPEIVHGKNALLGDSPKNIALLIKKACKDSALRMKIGEGGYETFTQYFTAEKVAPKIVCKIWEYINRHR